jgi:hypothetical protein
MLRCSLNYLPLREEFSENKPVFECVMYLYVLNHLMLLSNLAPVIKAGFIVLCEHQDDKGQY